MNTKLDNSLDNLNDCGCCQGRTAGTPAVVKNPPALAAIAYRVGTHDTFKQSMLAALSSSQHPALADLTTRDDDDFSIGLLDAWATMADVLTFYQERLANESYLRTATERLSVRELARLIGYRLKPGVAAAAHLAFTLDESTGAPQRMLIHAGVKVQSIPGPDEKPQTFETSEAIEARRAWNSIRPRLTKPQAVSRMMQRVVFDGIATALKPGDGVLIVEREKQRALNFVAAIRVNNERQVTEVDLQPPAEVALIGTPMSLIPGVVFREKKKLTDRLIADEIFPMTWKSADLLELAEIQGWSVKDLADGISKLRSVSETSPDAGVFAFRQKAAIFGHNAPLYASLPANMRKTEYVIVRDASGAIVSADAVPPAYPTSWEGRTLKAEGQGQPVIDLDRVYAEAVPGGWVALQSPTLNWTYQITAHAETSRSDFNISGKVSRLTLDGQSESDDDPDSYFEYFAIRETTVLAQSERLDLAERPIQVDIDSNRITLDDYYPYLYVGQRVILSGQPRDEPGVAKSELKTLAEVTVQGGFTKVTFAEALQRSYVRDTVTINANVAPATHGETVQEVSGSGDAGQKYQKFALRQPPLTHVPAQTPSGTESTLEVRVNEVLWHEVPTLYGQGPSDRVFITQDDDDGNTTFQFGDGVIGARLPTGQENVRVKYRKGIGLDGLVEAGQLSMLLAPPLGLKEVTNPLPATGADAPERLAEARRGAPHPLRTLDRAVSLQDYEDFSRAFAGIAKALATWTWDGEQRAVFVTAAGPNAAPVPPGENPHDTLLDALRQAGDPHVQVRLDSFRDARFQIEAQVTVHPDHFSKKVLDDVQRALRLQFSFDAQLGQPVMRSEVIAVIQAVPGVVGVDLNKLQRTEPLPDEPLIGERIMAAVPQAGSRATPQPAELLTLGKVELTP